MSLHNSSAPITQCSVATCLGVDLDSWAAAYQTRTSGLNKSHQWMESVPAPVGSLSHDWIERVLSSKPEWKSLSRLHFVACALIQPLFDLGRLSQYRPEEIGLSVSTTSAGLENWLAKVTAMGEEWSRDKPGDWFGLKDHGGTLAETILREFPIRGPDFTFATACSGGALAIAKGVELLRQSEIKACIVGGLDILTSMTLFGFNSLQVMDFEISRPFQVDRKGMNLSEGGAFFVLEKQPSSTPIGYINGFGIATDSYHMTQPEPTGRLMSLCMTRALTDAGWTPEDISYVNAHGTGTTANDDAEQKAITQTFGPDTQFESTKDLHGHCLAGAGAVETAMTLLALKERGSSGKALTNSFGFGGHNVSLALSLSSPNPTIENRLKVASPQHVRLASSSIGAKTPTSSTHPLWRRLTWMGKAVMEACSAYETRYEQSLATLMTESKTRVYFATMFGEIEAGLIVAEGILKNEVVVSPTSFQQSVANASAAYLMQRLASDAPTYTVTSGSGSYDRCLFLASRDLLDGVCELAIIINASEYHNESEDVSILAEAEICTLSSVPPKLHKLGLEWRLESVAWTHASDEAEREDLACPKLNLEKPGASMVRITSCGAGRSLQSFWAPFHREGLKLPAAALSLIPHRPPMLLVDTLDEFFDDGSATVSATLHEDRFYFDNQIFRSHWLVEILAQAIGLAFNGSRIKSGSAIPAFGFLLSVDDFQVVDTSVIAPGTVLKIKVRVEANLYPLGKYAAEAFLEDGTLVASGTMKFMCDETGSVVQQLSKNAEGRA